MTREKLPQDPTWEHVTLPRVVTAGRTNGIAASAWRRGSVFVISELATMEMPDGDGFGPTWLISVTVNGRRPKRHHMRRARRAFRMVDAEEDNHLPGQARGLFLVVDPSRRVDCECKSDETTVVEPDGYRWQRKLDAPR